MQVYIRDVTSPVVYLVDPANESGVDNTTVVLSFNVSDVSVNNCTLYIDGVQNETLTNVTPNSLTNFTSVVLVASSIISPDRKVNSCLDKRHRSCPDKSSIITQCNR